MSKSGFDTDAARKLLEAAQPKPFGLLDANGLPRLDQDRKCIGCEEHVLTIFDHAPGCNAREVARLFEGRMAHTRLLTHKDVCSALLAAVEEVELLRLRVIGLESRLARGTDDQP